MANLTTNLIDDRLTAQEVSGINDFMTQLEAQFNGKLRTLTKTQRIGLPKINEANVPFVKDAINAGQTASFLPAYFSVARVENDYALYDQYAAILLRLNQLREKVQDTMMLAGSEAYQNALAIYRMAQEAARNGEPGADAIADKLKTRFQQASSPAEPEAPATGFTNA
ncbi:hypothetical protein [Flaviaesturariibacter aridisoli]|uniref:Uncharacterized protein n=1 Tax=Flaviaesturariibacter aridisoli TaxID=2545761 RepID=A0A4R4E7Q7_9BACT|nr:hypothetical protein [Flaviaesturariibacter aridisoli]TCZ74101.1 hypothetical protein E0486_03230 [Flaviaesturariibacter aridisoli]